MAGGPNHITPATGALIESMNRCDLDRIRMPVRFELCFLEACKSIYSIHRFQEAELEKGCNNVGHVVVLNPMHKLQIAAALSRTSRVSTI